MPTHPPRRDEVPEADAIEQDAIVPDAPSTTDDLADGDTEVVEDVRELPADVPEADALEQSVPAFGEDEWPDDR
jgi:hypothetical protein